ncbi:mitogen-activated protein kinase kinase 4-like [Dioscorea cayenensis subsp. rotundata]|uniref:mitogen-activated protein kinase kinase n=1 Tax=Dioscorea cayennensis subsp. rotundata TaxID=55577 RepID=A0AB40ASQ0_DIOCR|nr:mitogen-activated protein kinase kinase 4-like [Dioscorea cayenensis subsp. rotundata]
MGKRKRGVDLTVAVPPPPPNRGAPLPLPAPWSLEGILFSDLERVRLLGSGVSGKVWMVRHKLSTKLYALKCIQGSLNENTHRQTCREIEILQTADSPFIIRCHGFHDNSGDTELLFEFMDGGSLEGHRVSVEPLLAEVSRQVLSAIAYLHSRRIVHRDIKPANILIDNHGFFKLADFGISRTVSPTTMGCKTSCGTILYLGPERFNNEEYDGFANDIWSFGITLLECYLGYFPFGENSKIDGTVSFAICQDEPPKPPETASSNFRDFISRCLQKDPASRSTAAQLLQHPFITECRLSCAPP